MSGTLERLANEMRKSQGPDYALAAKIMRYYLKNTDRGRLEAEANAIEDHKVIRYLYGAGLPQWLHDVVTERYRSLRE